ncbi:hypothetical protein TNCV_4703641 [Trichonephila clavipes]|nr:hypothetical protein TNCV_4703641 [Trichonephila clavipes]
MKLEKTRCISELVLLISGSTCTPTKLFPYPRWYACHTLGNTAVDDDNVCAAPVTVDKDILKVVQSSKNITDTFDFDGENEMNKAAPVPM